MRSVPNISVLCLRDYVEPETVLKAEMPACIASLVLACLCFYTLCLARDRAGPSRWPERVWPRICDPCGLGTGGLKSRPEGHRYGSFKMKKVRGGGGTLERTERNEEEGKAKAREYKKQQQKVTVSPVAEPGGRLAEVNSREQIAAAADSAGQGAAAGQEQVRRVKGAGLVAYVVGEQLSGKSLAHNLRPRCDSPYLHVKSEADACAYVRAHCFQASGVVSYQALVFCTMGGTPQVVIKLNHSASSNEIELSRFPSNRTF